MRAIFAGRRIGNGFKRAAVLYTNTHVENISVANGQLDLTKSPAGKKKDSLLKVLTQTNSTNLLQASQVHLRSPECVAPGRESIWEQAVWSAISRPVDQELELGKVVSLSLKYSGARTEHGQSKMSSVLFS